jgi:hypothetical protein
MRKNIYWRLLVAWCVVFTASEVMAQLVCEPYWTAEYKCIQHCGPCPNTNGGRQQPPRQQEQRQQDLRQQQLELEQQREMERQRDEAARIRKADEADQQGLVASNRGDWDEAARWFVEALGFAPDSVEIRAHLDRVNLALADAGSATAILEMRRRIEDSIAAAKIEALRQKLEDDIAAQRLAAMSEEFRVQTRRRYRPSGNAFIGGTTWIVGYNVQSSNPIIIAKAKEMLKKQMELAGLNYAGGIDFQRYNFVLGIAASTNAFLDLKNRVVFDEFMNGQFSAREQGLYNSLKGRQFGELACHSNGAMVCLAALENQDISADRVVLYGPQITRESLQLWNRLLQTGQVKSVQIYVNQNDPVPPFSLALGDLFKNVIAETALFNTGVLKSTINQTGSRIVVHTFSCGKGHPTIDCHDMVIYKRDRGCISGPPGKIVPGTSIHGKGGVAEPPSPC